jgi:hypothetical protein
MSSKLKSKKSRKKGENADDAATSAATAMAAKENVGAKQPTAKKGDAAANADSDFEKPVTRRRKKKTNRTSSTKKAADGDAATAASSKGADGGGSGGKKEGGKKTKRKSSDAAAKGKSGGKKKETTKISANTLAMHKRWQDAATDLGGGKIVISKAEAKAVIFDMLHDAFCPMNITQIHSSLKGVIPSPVLKTCLEEMVVDTTGGDEDNEDSSPIKSSKKNKKGGEERSGKSGDDGGTGGASASTTGYVDSLRLKTGRNSNNVLYFTNHDTSANGGNGLPPDERNELIAAEQKSAQDLQSIRDNLKSVQNLATKLLSEPTNQEAEDRIEKEEKVLADLSASVEESRQYAGNEKKREQTKKRIRDLADVWWKRRRMCNDFLQGMEDATEGTISVKKW